MQIHCVAAVRAQLGEGPLWDAARGLIWWLDIRAGMLHRHDVTTGGNAAQRLQCRLTALGLTRRDELIACGDRGFARLHIAPDLSVHVGEVLASPRERTGNRFNDGKVDDHGRFWAGTMDDAELGAHGALYRLDPGGAAKQIRTGISVPNGPCFLADGTMLMTDSPHRRITAVQLDEAGDPLAEREFARFGPSEGIPDGMTVDADDHVWVAFWDGWCVRRLSPAGRVVAEIGLPVQRPTCPVFGGPRLQHLYVTTATTGLSAAALAAQPLAGNLLRLEPGVEGLPTARFAG
ncbi:MAG TPA: SMP-30/gluconolactonase/LRE family protein [Steroidobacteraceae bacterium]|jgi:sugar lactone lactonase YvrE|nr:SMP-30/gluconolactonase/LRE family protein [Steroidobacteraceae bacterium]